MAKHSALHISCHSNTDRRIISEMNSLVANGWDVAFLHTPLDLRNSGVAPEIQLLSCADGTPRSTSSKRCFKRKLFHIIYTLLTHLPLLGVPFFQLAAKCYSKLIFRQLDAVFPRYIGKPDVIHVHDVWLLEYAKNLQKQYYPDAKLIYDAHEFTPFQTSLKVETKVILQIEGRHIGSYDAVISVNQSIAEQMAELYQIDKPLVLYNSVSDEFISKPLSRAEFLAHWNLPADWPEDNCIILYQGTLSPERNLENLVSAFALLPDNLHLFMLGSGPLYEKLTQIIVEKSLSGKVHMAEAVDQLQLMSYTQTADIGVVPYVAFDCANNYYATPNKLFEYIAAELPICGSDLPEFIKIFSQYHNGCGYPMNNEQEIAAALSETYYAVCVEKQVSEQSLRNAQEAFSYSKQGSALLSLYDDLLKPAEKCANVSEKASGYPLVKALRQLFGESAIYGIAYVITGLTVVLLTPIYTYFFTAAEYGFFSLLLQLSLMIITFSCLGLDSAAARWFYDSDDIDRRKSCISSWFWTQLICAVGLAAVGFLFRQPIVGWLGKQENLTGIAASLDYALLMIPVSVAGGVFFTWVRLHRRAWMAVIVAALQLSLSVGLVFYFLSGMKYGLPGAVLANVLVAAVVSLLAWIVMKGYLSPKYFSWKLLKDMFHFALPMIPEAICLWIMLNMDRVMLKELSDMEDVGLYAVASTFSLGVGILTRAFAQAWNPFAYSIMNDKNAGEIYSKVGDIYSFVGCLACSLLALCSPILFWIFTSKAEYYAAASLVGLLTFGSLFNGVRYIAVLGCAIVKKSVPGAVSIACGALINLILNYLLIPPFGCWGAAVATVVAWGSGVIYLYIVSQKYHYIPYKPVNAILTFGIALAVVICNSFYLTTGSLLANIGRFIALFMFLPMAWYMGLLPKISSFLTKKKQQH